MPPASDVARPKEPLGPGLSHGLGDTSWLQSRIDPDRLRLNTAAVTRALADLAERERLWKVAYLAAGNEPGPVEDCGVDEDGLFFCPSDHEFAEAKMRAARAVRAEGGDPGLHALWIEDAVAC